GDSSLIGCTAADTREPCMAWEAEPFEWRHHDHIEYCARHDVIWPLLHGLGGSAALDQQPSLIRWAFSARLPDYAYCARTATALAAGTTASPLDPTTFAGPAGARIPDRTDAERGTRVRP